MEKEENVYALNEGTEERMEEKVGTEEACPENASAVPNKFKDVDALARAYASLQAEFTRRSQRLRELEKLTENLGVQPTSRGGSGAEKLRKNAQARRAEKKAFDAFVADMGRANTTAQTETDGADTRKPEENTDKPLESSAKENAEKGGETENTENTGKSEKSENFEVAAVAETENAAAEESVNGNGEASPFVSGKTEGAFVAERTEKELSAESLYGQVCRNEEVRLKIIGEYLASVGKTAAPLTVGGVGAFATPPRKVGSIGDAGDMALLYFKNSGKIE